MYVADDTLLTTNNFHMGGIYDAHVALPTEQALAIDEKLELPHVHIFPNPADRELYIVADEVMYSPIEVSLFDLQGSMLVKSKGLLPQKISTYHMSQGIYVVRIVQEGKTAMRKVKIKHN